MIIESIGDNCSRKYELYMNQAKQSVELRLNMII